tara:strand:+ start:297 stop:521 length:225 start_codon:yes stop_codon:yes gene_type:complete
MNEEILKKIISKFLKISPDQINDHTILDNSVLQGSILFHRMISRINDYFQIEIKDYHKIKNYSNLVSAINDEKK